MPNLSWLANQWQLSQQPSQQPSPDSVVREAELPDNQLNLQPYENLFDPSMSAFNTNDPLLGYTRGPPGEQVPPFEGFMATPTGPTTFTARLPNDPSGNIEERPAEVDPALQTMMDRQSTGSEIIPRGTLARVTRTSGGANTLEQLASLLAMQSTGRAPERRPRNPPSAAAAQPGQLPTDLGYNDIGAGNDPAFEQWLQGMQGGGE